jgi:hypothetical protein
VQGALSTALLCTALHERETCIYTADDTQQQNAAKSSAAWWRGIRCICPAQHSLQQQPSIAQATQKSTVDQAVGQLEPWRCHLVLSSACLPWLPATAAPQPAMQQPSILSRLLTTVAEAVVEPLLAICRVHAPGHCCRHTVQLCCKLAIQQQDATSRPLKLRACIQPCADSSLLKHFPFRSLAGRGEHVLFKC